MSRIITLRATPYITAYSEHLATGHYATRWQIRRMDTDPIGVYWPAFNDSGWSTVHKMTYTVTLPDGEYEARVAFMNNAFEASDWSYTPDEELPEGEEPPSFEVIPFTDGVDDRFKTGSIMVQDADLEWREVTDLDLTNWVMEADWTENLEDASMSANVEAFLSQTEEDSLSPLMEASLRNRNAEDTFAPWFQPGRGLRIWMQHEDEETLPNTTLVFDGIIDTLDFANRMKAECRDRFSNIIDRMIETPKQYDAMMPHELLQQMLIDNFSLDDDDDPPPVLYTLNGTPEEPINEADLTITAVFSPFTQSGASLGQSMRDIAQLYGWDVGYLRNPAGSDLPHRLTFYQRDRQKIVPDREFSPDEYYTVNSIKISRIDVRNIVRVAFYASAEATVPQFVTVRDNASIAKYGRRFMLIAMNPGDQINTIDEAFSLASAALHDLAEPYASKEVEMPLYWQGQVGDLYRFLPNGIHYDTALDLAPVSLTHTVREGNIRTSMQLRGNVVGAFRDWLNRESQGTQVEGGGATGDIVYLGLGDVSGVDYDSSDSAGDSFWLQLVSTLAEGDEGAYDLILERSVVITSSFPAQSGRDVGPVPELDSTQTFDRIADIQTVRNALPAGWVWVRDFSVYNVQCDITWTCKLTNDGAPTEVVSVSSLKISQALLGPIPE